MHTEIFAYKDHYSVIMVIMIAFIYTVITIIITASLLLPRMLPIFLLLPRGVLAIRTLREKCPNTNTGIQSEYRNIFVTSESMYIVMMIEKTI